MSYLSNITNEEKLYETKLHIKLTRKGLFIYGEWSKEKLLSLLKDKIAHHKIITFLPVCNDTQCDESLDKSIYSIIHSGIYNEYVLAELKWKSMSPNSIMKAIKYGLLSLNSKELECFQDFGVEMHMIKNDADMWITKLDERLIWNLIIAGLTENQCWNIVMQGLVSQNESILCQLLSSGIDVPGILSWPGQTKPVVQTIIRFMKKLGIDEDTLCYVNKNGINDEIENMLNDLGYNEYKKKETLKVTEEILCECSLTILESFLTATLSNVKTCCSCNLDKATLLSSVSSSVNTEYSFVPSTCTCHVNLLPKENNETIKRNNYLRQNVMVPLTWAIGRTLRYRPSDPKHYIAHQLLRWKYGNVSQEEIHKVQQFVISATIVMDQKLVEKRKREAAIRHLNETELKDIVCDIYSERQKLYRIKKHCWKCTRVP